VPGPTTKNDPCPGSSHQALLSDRFRLAKPIAVIVRLRSKRTSRIRYHHLVKTFWGWAETQLPDGTLILTSPAGRTHITTPGSALLFPSLCRATGGMLAPEAEPPPDYCGERTAMPTRRRTRAQNRTYRIAAERRQNRDTRVTRRAEPMSYAGPAPPHTDDDPPPF
jgi:hypothetical protein